MRVNHKNNYISNNQDKKITNMRNKEDDRNADVSTRV